MDGQYLRELEKLKSDQNIGKIQLQSYQSEIANSLLNGGMGEDMKDIITNKKKIEGVKKESVWKKISRAFDTILKAF